MLRKLIVFVVVISLFSLSTHAISTCQEINVSGQYQLTANLSADQHSCLHITTSNVELSCQGYSFTSPGYVRGIHIDTVSNVTIENCFLDNHRQYPILVDNSNNVLLQNITVIDSVINIFSSDYEYGLFIDASTDVVARNLNLTNVAPAKAYGALSIRGNTNFTLEDSYIGPSNNVAFRSFNSNNQETVLTGNRFFGQINGDYDNSLFYNNIFNGSVSITGSNVDLNTSLISSQNIYGGPNIGGNYYSSSNSDGFSDVCPDDNNDGFCDAQYDVENSGFIDYMPLTTQGQAFSGNEIDSCRKLYFPGEYVLNQSILNSNTDDCIEILTDDVSLNCQGFTLDGASSTSDAISLDGYNNFTLQNCNITDWRYQVRVGNADDVSILNSSFTGAQYNQLNFFSISNFEVRDSLFSGSPSNYPLRVATGTNGLVVNNIFNTTSDVSLFTLTNVSFNEPITSQTNIYGGPSSSGNYWGDGLNTGFSDECGDANNDGFCDDSYTIGSSSYIDANPLTTVGQEDTRFIISRCKEITDSGRYVMESEVVRTQNRCIEISTDNVEIDCQGNDYTGGYQQLFNSDGFNNISIRNCNIEGGYEYPINIRNANDVEIINVAVNNSVNGCCGAFDYGLYFLNIDGLLVKNMTLNNVAPSDNYGSVMFNNVVNFVIEDSSIGPSSIANAVDLGNGAFDHGVFRNNDFRGQRAMRAYLFGGGNLDNVSFYNNVFFGTFSIGASSTNLAFNTSRISGTNIRGGPYIAGNFWGYENFSGFSQTCSDSDNDLICDTAYNIEGLGFYDYQPLRDPILTPIYASPTPASNYHKVNLSSFTVNVSSLGQEIDSCVFEINSQNYTMDISGSFCSYTYSVEQNQSEELYEYRVYANVSNSLFELEQREIGSYTLEKNPVEVPALGFGSIIIALLIIFGGLFK